MDGATAIDIKMTSVQATLHDQSFVDQVVEYIDGCEDVEKDKAFEMSDCDISNGGGDGDDDDDDDDGDSGGGPPSVGDTVFTIFKRHLLNKNHRNRP